MKLKAYITDDHCNNSRLSSKLILFINFLLICTCPNVGVESFAELSGMDSSLLQCLLRVYCYHCFCGLIQLSNLLDYFMKKDKRNKITRRPFLTFPCHAKTDFRITQFPSSAVSSNAHPISG